MPVVEDESMPDCLNVERKIAHRDRASMLVSRDAGDMRVHHAFSHTRSTNPMVTSDGKEPRQSTHNRKRVLDMVRSSCCRIQFVRYIVLPAVQLEAETGRFPLFRTRHATARRPLIGKSRAALADNERK